MLESPQSVNRHSPSKNKGDFHRLAGWLASLAGSGEPEGAIEARLPGAKYGDYVAALGIFAVAVVARLALDLAVPGRLPYITFFPAVFFAAQICGDRPALLVVALSAVVGAIWLDPADIDNPALTYPVGVIVFLLASLLIVFFTHELRVANAKLRAHEAELELVNSELRHRIKNLFAIADAVCQQTISRGGSREKISRSISERLSAIARTQDLLGAKATDGAELAELVNRLVRTIAPDEKRLLIKGEKLALPSDLANPFALILHELATNAVKYGAWSNEKGCVDLSWHKEQQHCHFRWRECGGPGPSPKTGKGLGRTLIEKSLAGAAVEYSLKPDGLECSIQVALRPA